MREQQASGQSRLCILATHREDRAASASEVIVDSLDLRFLPIEQLELLTSELAFRDETSFLNERDDVGRSDLVIVLLLALTHAPLSPTAGILAPARTVDQRRGTRCASAAWRAADLKDRRRSSR